MRIVALLALALLPALAAADTLYVTEFVGAPPASVYYQAARMPALAKQIVAISGTSTQSAVFGTGTGLVRLHVDVNAVVEVGPSPTAVTASMRMIAGQTEYFVVRPGDRVAVKTP